MTMPDHPALIVSIGAAIVYLWLTLLNPLFFAAVDYRKTHGPIAIDNQPVVVKDIGIENAPMWD
ncbi:MAG: hypothetical protein WBX25_31495 [Rhodomicrobium sp.]